MCVCSSIQDFLKPFAPQKHFCKSKDQTFSKGFETMRKLTCDKCVMLSKLSCTKKDTSSV